MFSHLLKLFPDSPGGQISSLEASAKPILSERYDEIVFNALPTDEAYRAQLFTGPIFEPPPYPYQEFLSVFSPESDLAAVAHARMWVAERTKELEDRLAKAKNAESAIGHVLPALGIT